MLCLPFGGPYWYVLVSSLGHVRVDKREAGDRSCMGLCVRAGPQPVVAWAYVCVLDHNPCKLSAQCKHGRSSASCTEGSFMRGERHTESWSVYVVACIDAWSDRAVSLALQEPRPQCANRRKST